jgi:hypothetical protein
LRKSNGFGILETGFQGRFLLTKPFTTHKENIMAHRKRVSAKGGKKAHVKKARHSKRHSKKSVLKA